MTCGEDPMSLRHRRGRRRVSASRWWPASSKGRRDMSQRDGADTDPGAAESPAQGYGYGYGYGYGSKLRAADLRFGAQSQSAVLHHTRGKITRSRSPGSQLNKAGPEFGGGLTEDDRADDQLHHQTVVLVAHVPVALPIGLHHSRGDLPPTTSSGGKGHLIDAATGPTPVQKKDIAFNEDVPLLIHVPGSISALDPVPVLVGPDTLRQLRHRPGCADRVEAPERLSGEWGISSHDAILWKRRSNWTADYLQAQATWVEDPFSRLPDASAES